MKFLFIFNLKIVKSSKTAHVFFNNTDQSEYLSFKIETKYVFNRIIFVFSIKKST